MESFIELHKKLLKEEHEAEIQECNITRTSLPLSEMQSRGVCISKLHILSMKTGLYGRTIIKVGRRGGVDLPLPTNNFSSGDIVDVHLKRALNNFVKPELQGVVMSVKDCHIGVALEGEDAQSKADELNTGDQSLILFKTANEVTYKRLLKGLDQLSHHNGACLPLIDICFNATNPTCFNQISKTLDFNNTALNDSQKGAIEFALSQRELAVIHGPPGTGKTTTVVELIAQLVMMDQKVLACAPSNVAIDNILEKLSTVKVVKFGAINPSPAPVKLLRLGHPARMLSPHLHKLSLDAKVAGSEAAGIVKDIRNDLDKLYACFRRKHNKQERHKYREEKTALMKELKDREKRAISEILSSADVVLATNVGAHGNGPLKYLPENHFDVVVIDECGQALESSCWIPMLRARKCILAGDHLQLPPTVKSHTAAAKGLSKSLLERVVNLQGDDVVRMLDVQYRMNHKIMDWSSQNMYKSKLKAHESVMTHLLADMPGVEVTEETLTPLLFIDTAGCDMPELQTVDNESISNPGEAGIVASHACALIEAGIDPKDIAVISPYNLQVDLLRNLLRDKYPQLEIRSVDGFQGREKEAVILSLVRSNDKGIVGFLSDDRRTNVAVTRARRHLTLICDSSTVGRHSFLKTIVDHMNEHGEVKSAYEFKGSTQGDEFQFDASAFIKSEIKKPANKKNGDEKLTAGKPPEKKEDLTKIKQEFRSILVDLVSKSDSLTHEFPAKLKSYERLVIHELCEEFGLEHESIGEGRERKIVVSIEREQLRNGERKAEVLGVSEDTDEKSSLETETDLMTKNTDSRKSKEKSFTNLSFGVEHDTTASSETKALTNTAICSICGRKLPPENMHLHQIHCDKLQAMKHKLQSATLVDTTSKNKKTQKVNKKKKKKVKNGPENKDKNDDELLEEAIRMNNRCSYENCHCSLSTVGQVCEFCKKSYCLEHSMPEVHGCGMAAHMSARRQICRDGVLYAGSRNLPAAKHAHLQQKLGGKLKEMEARRKTSSKKK